MNGTSDSGVPFAVFGCGRGPLRPRAAVPRVGRPIGRDRTGPCPRIVTIDEHLRQQGTNVGEPVAKKSEHPKKPKHRKKPKHHKQSEHVAAAETNEEATSAGPPRKMKRAEYEAEMAILQGELVAMQEWVKASGAKICIVFEGLDSAGKGGTIRRITERTSPRVFKHVALPAPTEREGRRCTCSATWPISPPRARS